MLWEEWQHRFLSRMMSRQITIAMNMVAQVIKKEKLDAGHDGTWIAHPGLSIQLLLMLLIKLCLAKTKYIKKLIIPNITQKNLLKVPLQVEITEKGLRDNIKVGSTVC